MAQQNNNNVTNGNGKRRMKVIGALVLIVLVGMAVVWLKVVRAEDDPLATMATFAAKRGPLTISVLESGAIKAKEQEVIRNEVEGRTTIISIVPEGTYVKPGDLLIELDASSMDDQRIDQEIRVQNADAAFVNAQEAFAIAENQAKSDIEKAELTLKFAKQDLTLYLEGKYLNDRTSAMNRVEEANEVLIRAREVLRWSQTLFDEKYISETELKADRLAVTKNTNSLTVAKNDLRLLEEFTKQRNIDQYTSDVNQAEMALERTQRKATANVVQAKAELGAKEQELKRQQAKLDKLRDQINKAKVYSPAEGMVVYATSSRGGFGRDDRRPLADGVEVYERQELIYIPKSSSSVAEVDVHEASLEKVRAGLPAIVTVDALPGKKFLGTVARIAPLPNAQSMWMNPDLKVYTTNINLQSPDPALRSGMSCKAEIIVEQYQDVVYIPVQAVLRVAGQPTVFVVKDGQIEERKVEIGLDNNSMVVIFKELGEGELVLMTPPLKAATLEPGERIPGAGDANDVVTQQINQQLKAVGENPPSMPRLPAGGAEGTPGQGPGPQTGTEAAGIQGQGRPGGPGGFQNMSQEEREKAMQERLNNMTPEERQQMEQRRKQFESMTEEERQQMRQRRGSGGRGGEGGAGFGGRGGEGGPAGGGRRGGAEQGSGMPERGQ